MNPFQDEEPTRPDRPQKMEEMVTQPIRTGTSRARTPTRPYGFSAKVVLTIGLLGCALPHVPPAPRISADQRATLVRVDSGCTEKSPFADLNWPDDASSYEPDIAWFPDGMASGVAISERHVLTAAHRVRCPIIPPVSVTTRAGRTLRMSVERDDEMFGGGLDVARLHMASLDYLRINVAPPELARALPGDYVCAVTFHGNSCGEVKSDPTITDAITRPGDSGAGVYDSRGRLVGLVSKTIWCLDGHPCATRIVPIGPYWLEDT